jgi:hypothetical protein
MHATAPLGLLDALFNANALQALTFVGGTLEEFIASALRAADKVSMIWI